MQAVFLNPKGQLMADETNEQLVAKLRTNGHDAHVREGKVLIWLRGRWWRVVGGDARSPSLIASQGFGADGNPVPGPLSGIEPPKRNG